jgi:hypothetical protein
VTSSAEERASFLKINDILFFWNAWLPSLLFYSVSRNANSMVNTVNSSVSLKLSDMVNRIRALSTILLKLKMAVEICTVI